jgi:LytR cell envelope-related transcriptional attenuator
MTTSAIRGAILALAVVVGILVLGKAFSGNATEGVAPKAVKVTQSPPSGRQTSPTPPPTKSSKPPRPKTVVVQVMNGTTTDGLAASTTQTIKNAGYKVKDPDNYVETATTTLFYRSDSRAAAQALADRFFPGALLKKAPGSFSKDIAVTVVLGADFAASASPSG